MHMCRGWRCCGQGKIARCPLRSRCNPGEVVIEHDRPPDVDALGGSYQILLWNGFGNSLFSQVRATQHGIRIYHGISVIHVLVVVVGRRSPFRAVTTHSQIISRKVLDSPWARILPSILIDPVTSVSVFLSMRINRQFLYQCIEWSASPGRWGSWWWPTGSQLYDRKQ
eukprot:759111-Hanusia_phi.AAC.1